MNAFSTALLQELGNTIGHWYPANCGRKPFFLSEDSFATGQVERSTGVKSLLAMPLFNSVKRFLNKRYYRNKMMSLDLGGLDKTYSLLSNKNSRDLLVRVMAFRLIGATRVQLPLHDPAIWKDYFTILEGQQSNKSERRQVSLIGELYSVDLNCIGYPISLLATPVGAFIEFCYRQYEYHDGGVHIGVSSGDVVIKGGACYGESTVFFASQCGSSGRVYAFEIVDENISILEENFERNPTQRSSIRICKEALSDKSGEIVSFAKFGAGSFAIDQWKRGDTELHDRIEATTVSIDDFVQREKLDKLDFIKMDIEGSEFSALRGAKKTLQRFKPKLAICLYHKMTDFVDIPQYLHEIVPEYRFYLKHSSVCEEETVLFATAAGVS